MKRLLNGKQPLSGRRLHAHANWRLKLKLPLLNVQRLNTKDRLNARGALSMQWQICVRRWVASGHEAAECQAAQLEGAERQTATREPTARERWLLLLVRVRPGSGPRAAWSLSVPLLPSRASLMLAAVPADPIFASRKP
jgi:hypothetical protein